MNTTQHWRGHVTNLLSHEFLKLVEARLKPNGIYYFNATTSNEAQRTAVVAFPYALRISSMVAVSNSPIRIDPSRWRQLLTNYVIDGRPTFHLDNPWQRQRFEQTLSLASDFGTRSSTRPDEQPFLGPPTRQRREAAAGITEGDVHVPLRRYRRHPLPGSASRRSDKACYVLAGN